MEMFCDNDNDLPNPIQEILWLIGDWVELAKQECCLSDVSNFQRVVAFFQLGEFDKAKSLVNDFLLDGKAKKEFAMCLMSGVYNSLARAYLCENSLEKAQLSFDKSVFVLDGITAGSVREARKIEQAAQLGVPLLSETLVNSPVFDKGSFLLHAVEGLEEVPFIQIALAEQDFWKGQYTSSIRHWQSALGSLAENAPQAFYDRLMQAYSYSGGFQKGTAEQEYVKGAKDKHIFLKEIHKYINPEFYFEIGVQTGASLALAECKSIGVDPMPMVSTALDDKATVIKAGSDQFFREMSHYLAGEQIDLVFIDGMHLFEYLLRDFINVERYSSSNTIVIVDDIYPCHPDQALRDRITRAWTGDVWKLVNILKVYRPELVLKTFDVSPTGLLVVKNLDTSNDILSAHYDEIVMEFKHIIEVPPEFLDRRFAHPPEVDLIV